MQNYLSLLSKEILKNIPEGLTKVKFAKIIYLTHKNLVEKNLIALQELRFIRMPLGPVPCGFKDLQFDSDIKVEEIREPKLLYDMQLYRLKEKKAYLTEKVGSEVSNFIRVIKKLPTSHLVELSHLDPSWISNRNGNEYFITKEDLLNKVYTPMVVNEMDEPMRLQATLMKGMLTEIVDESTSLEYPDDEF